MHSDQVTTSAQKAWSLIFREADAMPREILRPALRKKIVLFTDTNWSRAASAAFSIELT
jgi:hypothetical protein